ncbi:MAG: response regulator [Deltaproteobacteria bacterium]
MSEAREHVLVVEDEPVIQELIVETLEEHGYRVTVAASQDEAYSALRGGAFHVVLLDMKLPATTDSMEKATEVGIAILEWIKSKALKKAGTDVVLPVIVLTAFADVELVRTAYRGFAEEFLTKPFSEDEVIAAMAAAISGKKAAAMPPSQDSLVRIAFHDDRQLVQVETIPPITGRSYELIRELGRSFEEDVRASRDPAKYCCIPQKKLAACLKITDASVGKYVERLRTRLSEAFRTHLSRSLHPQAVVENRRDWAGYRLNPVTVRIVDPADLPPR